jgi:hypothetical protein
MLHDLTYTENLETVEGWLPGIGIGGRGMTMCLSKGTNFIIGSLSSGKLTCSLVTIVSDNVLHICDFLREYIKYSHQTHKNK